VGAAAVAAATLLVSSAAAQTPQVDQCVNKNRVLGPDIVIRACTAVIDAGPHEARIAWALGNRGGAWSHKGDMDRAIADYDEATRLAPTYALGYEGLGAAWRVKGDKDNAIANYNEAIWLNRKDGSAYASRGETYYEWGDLAEAVADLKRGNELIDEPYAMIWLFLARQRIGQDGVPDLTKQAAKLKTKEWPFAVIDALLGRRTLAQMQAAAINGDQACEAQFYGGEWHILHGNADEARTALQRALDTCPKNFIEYSGARGELARMTH
jgi:lipoprotein NlpI